VVVVVVVVAAARDVAPLSFFETDCTNNLKYFYEGKN
jgi:hypothetical protein